MDTSHWQKYLTPESLRGAGARGEADLLQQLRRQELLGQMVRDTHEWEKGPCSNERGNAHRLHQDVEAPKAEATNASAALAPYEWPLSWPSNRSKAK